MKLEALMDKQSDTGKLWSAVAQTYLKRTAGRLQMGAEPKGDLERRLQAWIDQEDLSRKK